MKTSKTVKFLDLFSGCGGLSLGLEKAGHECVGAIDHDANAIHSFNQNHSKKVALCRDLLTFSPEEFQRTTGVNTIDLLVGGPPCQGFSVARRVGGTNSGPNLVIDPRRDLYKVFLTFLEHYRPQLFVMENVLGIRTTAAGHYFTEVQNESRNLGYNVSAVEVKCWEFGVPQNRARQLFIGTRVGSLPFAANLYLKKTHSERPLDEDKKSVVTLGEAIGDLPQLTANSGQIESNYDFALRAKHLERYGDRYLYGVLEVDKSSSLTWHIARMHSERDLRDFDKLEEGQTSRQALAAGVEMEFPYCRDSFKDRYTRQHRDRLCSTIVAHLRRDGLMFIHPKQRRSLTPREAARIQSFPDTFQFLGNRGDVYQQIGNAVPPEVGKALGFAITAYLEESKKSSGASARRHACEVSMKLLWSFINSPSLERLESVPDSEFIQVWMAIHRVKPTVHPDNALDESGPLKYPPHGQSLLIEPYYLRTGWPYVLIPIAREAATRYKSGKISASQYYFQSTE